MGVVQRQQPVLPLRQPEEVAGLFDPFDRRAGRRDLAAVSADDELAFGIKRFVAHGVPAGVLAEVDFAGIEQAFHSA